MNAPFYFGTPVLDRCFWRVGEGCGSLAKAQATAWVDVPTTLSLSLWSVVVAGERSVLVSGDDEDEGEAHPHLSQPLHQ